MSPAPSAELKILQRSWVVLLPWTGTMKFDFIADSDMKASLTVDEVECPP
jgi:hypothetical protein